MKIIYALILTALSVVICLGQDVSVDKNDLNILSGPKWIGELTYLDYSSNKKTSIKSNVTVEAAKDKLGRWTFKYEYPDEPKANTTSEVSLSNDGKSFSGQTVIERSVTDGTVRIVTTKEGTDNDRKALFRFTYSISKDRFSIRKDVQIEESKDWFERNTYNWSR